jgi:hypothetical protein
LVLFMRPFFVPTGTIAAGWHSDLPLALRCERSAGKADHMPESEQPERIKLTEEELAIAKREVERGRVVVRTPVEERDELGEIALRREDVTVERVPVAPAVRSQAYDRLSLPGAHAAPTSTSERQPAASARIEFGHIDNTKLRRLLFS